MKRPMQSLASDTGTSAAVKLTRIGCSLVAMTNCLSAGSIPAPRMGSMIVMPDLRLPGLILNFPALCHGSPHIRIAHVFARLQPTGIGHWTIDLHVSAPGFVIGEILDERIT